jgi:hypothetical protein
VSRGASDWEANKVALGQDQVAPVLSDPTSMTQEWKNRLLWRTAWATDNGRHLCSLPGLFTQSFASIPNLPYLAAPPDRLDKFARLIPQGNGQLKIGIVWPAA